MIDQASRGAFDFYRQFHQIMQLRGDPTPVIAGAQLQGELP